MRAGLSELRLGLPPRAATPASRMVDDWVAQTAEACSHTSHTPPYLSMRHLPCLRLSSVHVSATLAFALVACTGSDDDATSTSREVTAPSAPGSIDAPLGSSLEFMVTVEAGQVLTVSPLPLPPNASVDLGTGRFRFVPGPQQVDAEYTLDWTALEGTSSSSPTTTVITVRGPATNGTTDITGEVRDADSEAALAGVPVRIPGGQATTTNSQGRFTLSDIPTSTAVIEVDGLALAPQYAFVAEPVELLLGHPLYAQVENAIPRPIYIPELGASGGELSGGGGTVTSMTSMGEVRLVVAPGSAMLNGAPYDGPIFIPEVPAANTPAALPAELGTGFVIAIQPAGISFTEPALITFPNFDNLQENTKTNIWSVNPATGDFIVAGEGTVRSNGTIETTFGGVRNASWHFPLPSDLDMELEMQEGTNGGCSEAARSIGSDVALQTGTLLVRHETPAYVFADQERSVSLLYSSATGQPGVTLGARVRTDPDAPTPGGLTSRINLANLGAPFQAFTDISGSPSAPHLLRHYVPTSQLPTGLYPYSFEVEARYPTSTVTTRQFDEALVVNETNSPYGAGWCIEGVPRLSEGLGGAVLRIDGRSHRRFAREEAFVPVISTDFTDQSPSDWSFVGSSNIGSHSGGFLEVAYFFGNGGGAAYFNERFSTDRFRSRFRYFIQCPQPTNGGNCVTNCGLTFGVVPDTGAILGLGEGGGCDHLYYGSPGGFAVEFDTVGDAGGQQGRHVSLLDGSTSRPVATTLFDVAGTHDVLIDVDAGRVLVEIDGQRVIDAILPNATSFSALAGFGAGVGGALNRQHIIREWDFEVPDETANVLTYASPRGVDGRLERDLDGTWTFRDVHDGIETFDADGRLTTYADRNGNTWTYAYVSPSSLALASVTDPLGGQTRFAYSSGRLSSITDPTGRTTEFQVDGNGDLIRIDDPDGTSRTFAYDSKHKMTGQTSKRGFVTEYEYDALGFLERSRLPDGTTREVAAARQQATVHPDLENTGSETEPNAPNSDLNPASVFVDELGRETRYRLDNLGQVLSVIDPLGRETMYERNGEGRLIRVDQPDGSATTFAYDERGNVTQLIELGDASSTADDRVTRFTYHDEFNLVTSVTDPMGNVNSLGATLHIERDEHGNPTVITDALDVERRLAYDESSGGVAGLNGLLTSDTRGFGTPDSSTIRLEYEPTRGSTFAVIDPVGRRSEYRRDAQGRVEESVNIGSSAATTDDMVTSYSFDELNRVRTITDNAGAVTELRYTPSGALREVRDAKPGVSKGITTFTHDAMDRVVNRRDPLGNEETYAYYPDGLLRTHVDRMGQTFTWSYDNARRPISKEFPGSLGAFGNETVTWQYDNNANGDLGDDLDYVSAVTNTDATLGFRWSMFGELVEATAMAGAHQPASTVAYGYDANGSRTSMSVEVDGETVSNVTYTPDALSRLDFMVDSVLGASVDIDYDALSRRDVMTRSWSGQELLTNYDFNAASDLRSIDHTLSPSGAPELVSSFVYGYDALGFRDRLTETRAAIAGLVDDVHQYGYGPAGRLTSVGNDTLPDEAFTYDEVGNRLTVIGGGPTWQYNALDQLLNDGIYTYQWDDNGNLTQRRSIASPSEFTRYRWTPENRLAAVELPDGTVIEYFYDGLARRAARVRTVSGGGVSSDAFVYDREDIVQLLHDEPGLNEAVTFLNGPGIDEPLLQSEGGDAVALTADALGSIQEHVRADSALISSARYSAFGSDMMTVGTPAHLHLHGYTSRERSLVHDSNFNRARYLTTSIGRFISEEPARIDGPNLYHYSHNRPTFMVDPSGLQSREFRYNSRTGETNIEGCTGYSGTGRGRNNPEREGVRDEGPIPRGRYTIGPPRNSRRTGDFILDLGADGHDARGRDFFQIHGDNQEGDASQGCIILPRACREAINERGFTTLIVY